MRKVCEEVQQRIAFEKGASKTTGEEDSEMTRYGRKGSMGEDG